MGFLDVLRGKRALKKPVPTDRLFAMSTAHVTMDLELGLKGAGKAAIVFQPLATADFEGIVRDMEEVVRSAGSDTGTGIEVDDDDFGYRWMVLVDPDFEDLVVGLNAVSTALEAGGYGDRILCAVFAFRDEAGKPVYWIYNYKRGSFYPFVPAAGEQQRDNERELRLKAQIGAELPIEAELERWFPLWGIPI
ncbi:MAG: PspA-associated protein PspAB [Solirubrobacteraceae bacterium]